MKVEAIPGYANSQCLFVNLVDRPVFGSGVEGAVGSRLQLGRLSFSPGGGLAVIGNYPGTPV